MARMHMALFMENVALIGGALFISQFGAGPFSIDALRAR
jgi:putative oxidoreductase